MRKDARNRVQVARGRIREKSGGYPTTTFC